MELLSAHSSKTPSETPPYDPTSKSSGPGRASSGQVWTYGLIRTALGIIFIWSGISKLLDPEGFTTTIEAFGLIPDATILPAAMGLPVLELLAGAGLLLDMQGALGIITGLLILFTGVLSYGLWIGLDVDCGCFGPDDPEGAAYHSLRPAFYRDLVMLAGIGYLYLLRWRKSVYPMKLSGIYHILINIGRRK